MKKIFVIIIYTILPFFYIHAQLLMNIEVVLGDEISAFSGNPNAYAHIVKTVDIDGKVRFYISLSTIEIGYDIKGNCIVHSQSSGIFKNNNSIATCIVESGTYSMDTPISEVIYVNSINKNPTAEDLHIKLRIKQNE